MKKMKKSTYAACVIWYYGKMLLEGVLIVAGIYIYVVLICLLA